jgi:hypothetical protein
MTRISKIVLVLAAALAFTGCDFDMCVFTSSSLCGIVPARIR